MTEFKHEFWLNPDGRGVSQIRYVREEGYWVTKFDLEVTHEILKNLGFELVTEGDDNDSFSRA